MNAAPSATGIVPVDNTDLAYYMDDLARYDLLSHAEESDLTRQNTRDARERLVLCNLRLVVSIAKKYQRIGIQLADLIQEGNEGLMRAADLFDPQKGWRFSTYATYWIRQHITRFLQEKGYTIRRPVHVWEEIARIEQAERDLAAAGQEIGDAAIAALLNMRAERVSEVRAYAALTACSLDMPHEVRGSPVYLWDVLEDRDTTADFARVEQEESRQAVLRILSLLTTRERRVLSLRIGLEGRTHTLQEIARVEGVSRERIRQIERDAKRKLRHHPQARLWLAGLKGDLAS